MATLQTPPLAEAAPDHPSGQAPPPPDPALTTAAIRAEINRRNSLHSTGPSSPEGKEAVRLNALKTGIYAKTVVLPDEDHAAYDAIGAELAETYAPQNAHEKSLVQTVQDTGWRIQRLVQIETNLHLVVGMHQVNNVQNSFGPLDPLDNLALGQVAGYLANARAFDQLNKQEARLRRVSDALIRELRVLVANRPPQRVTPRSAAPVPPGPPRPDPKPDSGFVPPKPGVLDGVPRHVLETMPNFVGKSAEMLQAQWLKKHWYKR